jgi:ketosteroid isomerase-like protein
MVMNKIVKVALICILGMVSMNANAGMVDEVARKNIADWNYALKSGHVDAIMRFYTQNAMLVQSNGKVHDDVGQIRAFWENIVAAPGDYEFNLTEAHRDGNNIVMTAQLASIGSKQLSSNDDFKYYYNGNIQNVLKYQGNGDWKTEVQQWN